MEHTVEKLSSNKVKISFKAPAADFEEAVEKAYLKMRGQISVPGFRKGKAPRKLIERMYGAGVFYEDAANILIPRAYDEALKECEETIVSRPTIDITQIEAGKPFIFTAEVALKPEVTLGEYKGVEVPKTEIQVTDEEIQAEVDKERENNSRTIDVDDRGVEKGDLIKLDFDGSVDGVPFQGGKAEDYPLTVGSGSFIPGFEDQLIGAKIGEEMEVKVTFPEDYHAEDLKGKEAVFKCTVKAIQVKELPEADDEFAKDVSEFDTLDEYKADIRAKQEKQQQELADNKFRSDIIRQACDNMTVDIPAVMVDDKLEEMVRNYAANFGFTDRNTSLEDLLKMMGVDAAAIRPSAEMQVKTELLLEAVVKAENMEVTQEEADEYMNKVAEGIGAKVEDMKNYFSKEFIEDELKKERATNIIIDNAVEEKAEEKAE